MKNVRVRVGLILSLLVLAVNIWGQGVPAPYTLRVQTFLTGLSRPILIRNANDGSKRLFIVQQSGIIKVLQPGASTPTDFIDLSSKITVPTSVGDERGLLGLTFHPQFTTNGKFYVDYTRAGDGGTVIAEYTTTTGNGSANTANISTERIMLNIPQPFSNHNGGMVEFGPDGFLYIGMGDGGSANDPGNRAQNLSVLLGKLLRIDVNIPQGSPVPYLIPAGNPFTGGNTVRCDGGSTTSGNPCQEIWTYGMRNPWRWSFDRGGNHAMWVGDVGQGAREEVDVISSGGGNYGWRVYEGSQCNTGITGNCPTTLQQVPPIFDYTHSGGRCSLTGGYVYRGGLGSMPDGAYVYGDYCSGEIFMWNNNQQTLLLDTPRSIVSFGEDEAGELYICYNNGQIDKITRAKASADFDGDFKTDTSVFRPSEGTWYAYNSSNGTSKIQQFGLNSDIPTPEDYDADNIKDLAVFRPSNGTWYYYNSSSNTVGIIQWGVNGDIPVTGDFDGDAKADLAIYRNGAWWIRRSSNGSYYVVNFGLSGDVPVQSDFDGDGITDVAVWRPADGVWYRINSTNNVVDYYQFGLNGDIPTVGDYDGDNKSDRAVFRPSSNIWYLLRSTSGFMAMQWGASGDIPAAGDYDGDNLEDLAVYRPSNGGWYISQSSNGAALIRQYGLNGDLPAPAYDKP
ncbi:MAG: PQQ-dependent sugar dehydrogenase [Pyrinomonadaceae bacterium]